MMQWRQEWKALAMIGGVFGLLYVLPLDSERVSGALSEALLLTQWYAREHVVLCLIPAFFIAGAIAVFVSQGSVMKYLGPTANKFLSYGVASISGSVLAVCSCTVLPLFAGIYRMGAGLGPATAFLYAGPAINVLAIILTARILGFELGVARAVGAVGFSVVIGLLMHLLFRNEEQGRASARMTLPEQEITRPLWQNALFMATLVGILVFANWGKPTADSGFWYWVYVSKWYITAGFAVALALMMHGWLKISRLSVAAIVLATAAAAFGFSETPLLAFGVGVIGVSIATARRSDEAGEWLQQSWGFAKQIMPLLFGGVLVAGLLLGRPGHEGLIPSAWISDSVGGNSIRANLYASVVGAFMYFATLTEIPILQGLIGNGMGKGPALALLLAGPALSLPNMLVIRSIMGVKKTVVFVALVIVMATLTGILYGSLF